MLLLNVNVQGQSTASANAVSMALSQGAQSTAISQAVAQVVRLSPLLMYPLVADRFLDFKISIVIFGANKLVVMQTGSSAPASQVLFLWNSPMHGIVAWKLSMATVWRLVVFVPQHKVAW